MQHQSAASWSDITISRPHETTGFHLPFVQFQSAGWLCVITLIKHSGPRIRTSSGPLPQVDEPPWRVRLSHFFHARDCFVYRLFACPHENSVDDTRFSRYCLSQGSSTARAKAAGWWRSRRNSACPSNSSVSANSRMTSNPSTRSNSRRRCLRNRAGDHQLCWKAVEGRRSPGRWGEGARPRDHAKRPGVRQSLYLLFCPPWQR